MAIQTTLALFGVGKWLAAGGAGSVATVFLKPFFERSYATALDIGFAANALDTEPTTAIGITVTLTNRGKTKLRARRRKDGEDAYKDTVETIPFSCSLQVKKLGPHRTARMANWYSSDCFDGAELAANLMDDYEDPKSGMTDFWMEPGEAYRVGSIVWLGPGAYLAKVTFIGSGGRGQYWSRVVPMTVAAGGAVSAWTA